MKKKQNYAKQKRKNVASSSNSSSASQPPPSFMTSNNIGNQSPSLAPGSPAADMMASFSAQPPIPFTRFDEFNSPDTTEKSIFDQDQRLMNLIPAMFEFYSGNSNGTYSDVNSVAGVSNRFSTRAQSNSNAPPISEKPELFALANLEGHVGKVGAITFDPSGTVLVSGGHDKKLQFWDVRNLNKSNPSCTNLYSMVTHNAQITNIRFFNDRNNDPQLSLMATSSYDTIVKVYNCSDMRNYADTNIFVPPQMVVNYMGVCFAQ